jgi:hypothetical protein
MLLLLLGDVRAGLIVAAAIPLSAMAALIAMRYAGVSANLMSLGAVDFGVIVDGAVVMVENAVRSASRWQQAHGGKGKVPKEVFKESAFEVGTPILFAGLIVIIVFIPILSLEGVEGKMFKPMAFTFMSALTAALVLSVTVMPVMASLFLARKVAAKDTLLVRLLKRVYQPLLAFALRFPLPLVAAPRVVPTCRSRRSNGAAGPFSCAWPRHPCAVCRPPTPFSPLCWPAGLSKSAPSATQPAAISPPMNGCSANSPLLAHTTTVAPTSLISAGPATVTPIGSPTLSCPLTAAMARCCTCRSASAAAIFRHTAGRY